MLTPWVRKIPWSRKWQCTPVFLPGNFCGQRSLVDCSPWGHRVGHQLTDLTATAAWQRERGNHCFQISREKSFSGVLEGKLPTLLSHLLFCDCWNFHMIAPGGFLINIPNYGNLFIFIVWGGLMFFHLLEVHPKINVV